MRLALIVIICLTAVLGCFHQKARDHYGQIRIGNRSSEPIRFVTLDLDGRGTDFGFFGVGGGYATAADCRLSFDHDVVIQWKEKGEVIRSVVDLSPYATKAQQIKSVSIYYLGGGQWMIIAQDGDHPDSEIVEPTR